MIGFVIAAATALTPPAEVAATPKPQRPTPAAPASSARRRISRHAAPEPDLSAPADPYRGEASYRSVKTDPQHPSLAPAPDTVGEGATGFGRVSPVPPDPWAPVVSPLAPAGGIRPPDGGG
jgi:hypothetical protein